MLETKSDLGEFRLLLEELCCDLCRFEHVTRDGLAPEAIRIDREYWLGSPGAFADIRVAPAGLPPYFVEIKYGYPNERLVRHLARKYSSPRTDNAAAASKVVLVVDRLPRADWDRLERDVASQLASGLQLDVWDESRLLALLAERFNVRIPAITTGSLLDVRQAIDRAKGFHAFGGASFDEYQHDPLKADLLWHFGFWRIQQRQRRIDRVQTTGGLHVGVAIGDLQIVALRPFSRLHVGAIGDCINVASRLLAVAGPSEVVVSNAFHQRLDGPSQARCSEIEPVDARNVGRIRAWKVT